MSPDAPDPTPTDGGDDGTPDGLCDPYADYAGNDGTVVTIVGPIVPVEQQLFEDSWAEFEECTGIDIAYEGGDQREEELEEVIQSGGAPDIAWLSRPAALARLVASGEPIPAPRRNRIFGGPVLESSLEELRHCQRHTFYAAPVGSTMKSIVWYFPTHLCGEGLCHSHGRGMRCGPCLTKWWRTESRHGAVAWSRKRNRLACVGLAGAGHAASFWK